MKIYLQRICSLLLIFGFFSVISISAFEPDFPSGGGTVNDPPALPAVELEKRQNADERLRVFGPDLLGDGIDPHTGSIQFSTTDVSIPGNFNLPVEITRNLSQGRFYGRNVSVEFGDWQIQVPRMHVLAKTGVNWTGNRCTNTFEQSFPKYRMNTQGVVYWTRHQYTNGLKMDIPGQGSKDILQSNHQLFPAGTEMVTVDGWYLTCGSANNGQGFIGHAPDGTKYRFDRHIMVEADYIGSRIKSGPTMNRTRNIIAATQVTDVNGNTVNYDYDSLGRLTAIRASDGRRINLTYSGSSKLIRSVTANPNTSSSRTWTYTYAQKTFPEFFTQGSIASSLTSVTRPDGRNWAYDLVGMSADPGLGDFCPQIRQNLSVTHPHGVTGTFLLQQQDHRTSFNLQEQKSDSCPGSDGDIWFGGVGMIHEWRLQVAKMMSITKKTLSGPNMADQVWTYRYERDFGPAGTSGEDRTNETKVTGPTGVEEVFRHYWTAEPLGGKIASKEIRKNGVTLQREDYSYTQETAYGLGVIATGTTPRSGYTPTHITKTVTKRDGDTFTSEASFNTDQTSTSYSYSRPISTSIKSNVSTTPRVTVNEYQHNKTKWILGLLKKTTVNGRITDEYTYDSLGRKTIEKKYGHIVSTLGYHSNAAYKGALYSIKDANNRTTYALNWKRGTPQQIKRPDNISIYQYVDNNGWLTSNKDALNRTTIYTRDSMGRLTLFNPHGSWANTSISYNFNGGGAVQTITKANSRSVISYDAMFRPTREETRDLLTGISTYVNKSYDNLGRTIFTSHPSTNPNITTGVETTYDGLSRITKNRENVSPYAETKYNYYYSHRKRVTDPSGKWTDFYSYGYDGPGNDNYRAIYDYGNGAYQKHTYLYKNVWGEMTALRQWGNNNGYDVNQYRYFYYNNKRQVCRYREKEGGDTVYHYDDVGYLEAYQSGLSNSSVCSTPAGTAKVSLLRDILDRVTKIDYADGSTPDVISTYDAVNKVLTKTRGSSKWTYAYNTLDLLTSESLVVDGRTYGLSYTYNSAGHLNTKKLPSSRTFSFNPDGLGRARQAKYGSASYVNNITYHPSGQVKNMNYGNGFTFTQTLNNRLLPARTSSIRGSTKAIDYSYTYDKRALLTSITDTAVPTNNRSMSYDPLGQLISATGPWGTGSFKYDSLGNIREKTLGSRKVTLQYDSRNRVSKSTDTGGWGGNTGTRNLAYDARGNVGTLGGMNFVYDYANQPRSVSGSTSGSYVYDGNFKRVKSTTAGETIYNVFDASGGLVYIDNKTTGEKTDYIMAGKQTVARIVNSTITYLHSDHLGSPITGTNTSGVVQWRETYSPYGITNNEPVANIDQMGFTGHIKDSATGLNYMQARYYDPVIGRFLSTDPVSFMTSNPLMFNRYAYANNNPYIFSDPDGRVAQLVIVPARTCATNPACRKAVVTGAKATGNFLSKNGKKIANAASAVVGAIIGDSVFNESKDDSSVRGENNRPIDQPVDLEEELAVEEIVEDLLNGGGDDSMTEKMGDDIYDGETGTHDKVRGNRKHPDGTNTEVHGDRNRETGELSDLKIKDHPKSRGQLNSVE